MMMMDTISNEIYDVLEIFDNNQIDLSKFSHLDPWIIGLVCLKAIEYSQNPNKKLVLPKNEKTISYFKKMNLGKILNELSYKDFLKDVYLISEGDEDPNIREIIHCNFRDEFEARLLSKMRMIFKSFGMNENDEPRATTLLGELGNNVFDHNAGSWPMNFGGAIIIIQNYFENRIVEVVVADPGVGFRESLKSHNSNIKSDIEAIKLGLSGVTGRIGEKRGNGLKLIRDWTINHFNGIVRIHSGNGLVIIDKDGEKEREVFDILGTLASFVIKYK